MYALLLTSMLSLPLYPINPTAQDTLPDHSLHFSVGAVGPNDVVSVSPELTVKHEYLLYHPFVVRGAAEYRYGGVDSKQYPNGNLHSVTFALSILYYRGTNSLTGYLGAGVVYSNWWMSPNGSVSDSLKLNHDIDRVDITSAPGYRFTFGLRYRKNLSLELTLTNTRPDYVTERQLTQFSTARLPREIKLNDVRLSIGYLLPLTHRR